MKSRRSWFYVPLCLPLMLADFSDVPVHAQGIEGVLSASDSLDRTTLPIPEPEYPHITVLDSRDATAPPPHSVRAPDGAPNVVIVLLDDIGFGTATGFGGAIRTPTLDRLARDGLLYNQFHTTALCSPTRMAILTGRNHHSANTAAIMELATAFPGNRGQRPQSIAPLAEMLRLNGYSTAAFGKYHMTPQWEVSVSGPFDRWPTSSGFEKFYGFLGGRANQFAPVLHDGTTPVDPPDDPDYHFTTDMTSQAIVWVRSQQAFTPEKPFFLYFATGATHAPHQVPADWVGRYKGEFDDGWDAYRDQTLARQIELGVVPPGTRMTSKPADIADWEALSADEKRVHARQMEVFAAFAEHTDHEIGRLVGALEAMGEMDNTLFFYVFGDNGSAPSGGLTGAFIAGIGPPESVDYQLQHLDEWGGPTSNPDFSAGWAVATSTPFQWTKQIASHYGGTRNPLVVHWPEGITSKGEIRSQWHHVTDIAPTVMEAAGLPFPKSVNGATQKPFAGVSLMYSFDAPDAADRHTTQYFEILGNRAIYHDGWVAGAKHQTLWRKGVKDGPFDQDTWELYHVAEDFSQSNDLAASNPAKLKELQELFMAEAVEYGVLPLDDRTYERLDAATAGRPDLMGDRRSLTVYPGMTGMSEFNFINVKGRSHTITAEVEIPNGGVEGVILAQGGRFGGWSLYLKDGRVSYAYNWVGKERYTITASESMAPGKATIRFEFEFEGGGRSGGGGTGRISVDGQAVAEGPIGNTQRIMIAGDETTDVGMDKGTPVTEDYAEGDNEFTGKIEKVTVELL